MGLPGIPSPRKMWEKHEGLVLEVFILALELLRDGDDLPVDEDSISEKLAWKSRKANFRLNRKGRGLPFPPDWEKPRQPTSKMELGRSKKKKRPDFTCPFRNNMARNDKDAYLDYHIECKRLGKPSSPRWNFNRNYVTKGIFRFLDPVHGYGEGARSGAMIGYIQSMNLKDILQEVNSAARSNAHHNIPRIRFHEDGFDEKGIAMSMQELTRKYLLPSSFQIRHVWVDLRQKQDVKP